MKSLRIATLQGKWFKTTEATNAWYVSEAKKLKDSKLDILVLPELYHTPYFPIEEGEKGFDWAIEKNDALVSEWQTIAKELNVSPADLIGYRRPSIELNSLSDVIAVLYQLNKKAGIRFEIDVQRPPHSEEWSCSLRFKGNDSSAEMNDSLCLILEDFRDEREKLETYWTDQEGFDRWMEKELAYYAEAKLQDREVEVLTEMERIQRRNELDRQRLEQMKKAAGETDSQQ